MKKILILISLVFLILSLVSCSESIEDKYLNLEGYTLVAMFVLILDSSCID